MTPLPRRLLLLLALCTFAALLPLRAAETAAQAAPAAAPAPVQKPRFIYVLRLVERLHLDTGWTKADEEAVGRHFRQLKAATESGQVIMAGRTLEPGDKTFGLVVFEAENADAAQAFAESDPAVVAGVMTVEVRPFALVLMRKL